MNADFKDKPDELILEKSSENPNLFELLVDKYRAPFLRKAASILKSDEAAEDAIQETFVKIYIKGPKFKKVPGASFSSWAYRILINTCYTQYRKSIKEQSRVAEYDVELVGMEDRQFSSLIDLDNFMSLVSRLPAVLARILKLSVLEGKDSKGIAESEKISVGAARTRLHRAKKAFEKQRLELI